MKLGSGFYNRIAIAVLTLALGVYYASTAETPATELRAVEVLVFIDFDEDSCKEVFVDSVPVSHEITVVRANLRAFSPSPDSDTIEHWSVLIAPRPERGPPSAA